MAHRATDWKNDLLDAAEKLIDYDKSSVGRRAANASKRQDRAVQFKLRQELRALRNPTRKTVGYQ